MKVIYNDVHIERDSTGNTFEKTPNRLGAS